MPAHPSIDIAPRTPTAAPRAPLECNSNWERTQSSSIDLARSTHTSRNKNCTEISTIRFTEYPIRPSSSRSVSLLSSAPAQVSTPDAVPSCLPPTARAPAVSRVSTAGCCLPGEPSRRTFCRQCANQRQNRSEEMKGDAHDGTGRKGVLLAPERGTYVVERHPVVVPEPIRAQVLWP